MADSYNAQLSFQISSSLYGQDKQASFTDYLGSAQNAAAGIDTITTDVTALDLGDVSSTDQGFLYLKNLDVTNYLLYGSTDLEWKLDPGEFCFGRINPGSSIYVQANSTSIKVEKHLMTK